MVKDYQIGDKESYVYKRLAIQHGLRRRQQFMKFNAGGKGREKKMLNLNRFKSKEINFIQTFMHNLTSRLVKFCIMNDIGTIELKNIKELTDEAKNFPFVLRNWSYGGFINKIEYKCDINGITLVCN